MAEFKHFFPKGISMASGGGGGILFCIFVTLNLKSSGWDISLLWGGVYPPLPLGYPIKLTLLTDIIV